MRYAIALAFASFSFAAVAAEPVTIPVADIWAYRIEGTRDVRDLEPDQFGEKTKELSSEEKFKLLHASLTQGILDGLRKQDAKAFVVQGTGRAALLAAKDAIDGKVPRPLTSSEEVSIAFFCSPVALTCQLEDVTRAGNTIDIPYRLTRRGDEWVSAYFALIPLGKLPAGKYEVNFVQKPKPDNFGSKHVGESFTFEIK
jgi:hypothetical protein